MDSRVLRFDEFRVDPARAELTRDGAPVPVEPQVLDLIAFLAANAGQVVTRDQIIAAVWQGRIVSDSAISTRINAARTALGDDGSAQAVIRTVPRRGFLFVPKVTWDDPGAAPMPDRPSVAVLPFQNMSGDPEQSYFSDGITDDIITELCRYPELFVIARHSSFAYRDSPAPAAEIAGALGVRYLAEGSVRRAGQRIRVTARLIDPQAGNELWSERYDRELTDIFEVQDDIARVIVNTLAGEIIHQQYKRALTKSAETADAYDHFLRAYQRNWQSGPDDVRAARAEAERALALDPQFARALALISWTHISDTSNAWTDNPAQSIDLARDYALRAVAADDAEPFGHGVLGWVHMWRDRNFERGLAEQRLALAANPGSAHYQSMLAFSLAYAGQSQAAIEALQEAMRLNPRYPVLYHVFYGRALFNLHRYDQAIAHLERVRTAMPGNANAIAHTAACYAALGRMDDADETVTEVLRASPRFTMRHARRHVPYAIADEQEHFLSHLAAAGLPD